MQFKDLKEIVTFAIEKEVEAARFYEEVSQLAAMSGSREMLVEFAQQERKHEALLRQFMEKGVAHSVGGYTFKWITDIKRSDYVVDLVYSTDRGYSDLLMLAAKREEKALALYNELLKQTDSPEAKSLFKVLCQEEAKHKLFLETKYDDYMATMGD
jgi:rubrerythrin